MNKVFKIVFSRVKGMFVVGSEHISSHGKKSVKAAVAAAVLGVSLAGFSGSAMATSDDIEKITSSDESIIVDTNKKTVDLKVNTDKLSQDTAFINAIADQVQDSTTYYGKQTVENGTAPGTGSTTFTIYKQEAQGEEGSANDDKVAQPPEQKTPDPDDTEVGSMHLKAGDNVTITADTDESGKVTGAAIISATDTVTTASVSEDGKTLTIKEGDKDAITFTDTDTHTSVVSGSNITVTQSGVNSEGAPEYKVSLNDDINVNSVNAKTEINVAGGAKDGGTTINKEGVTTNKVQVGNSIVFQQGNINMGGNQIHGVEAGTADNDAVNFAQLKATEAQLNQRIDSVDKHIDRVEDNAYAGIAMALATAGLPQSWQPGKSMIAMAAGAYMGEQGYAIGISHNTEDGKWSFKATASGNSQGHFGGSVGAGYMW